MRALLYLLPALCLGCDVELGPVVASATPTSATARRAADGPSPGYLLISPLRDQSAYLLDGAGEVVHRWKTEYDPGNSAYLLPDGDLLRCAREGGNAVFHGGGEGGRVQRYSWDGELEWDFVWSSDAHLHHHDVAPLPNGNVLLLSWELKTREQCLAAGMDPALLQGDVLWPDAVFEVKPVGADGGEVVWAWHLWDHLVQEFDEGKANYGVVAEHPELVDLNVHRHSEQKSEAEQRAELERLRALGYAGDAPDEEGDDAPAAPETPQGGERAPRGGGGPGGAGEDFCHTNGIDYDAELDQILLSVRHLSEVWVIDHSTTTAEAASHRGGRSGKGGDLLWRWGNPQNYGRGLAEHRQLFEQHDARWIPAGYPGAGHITIFNNGANRPEGSWSSVLEVAPPVDAQGRYAMDAGEPFGPRRPTWEYAAPERESFFSGFISGAERQPNGNTLICSGSDGRVFEVTPQGALVWEWKNVFGEAGGPGGPRGGRRGPPGGPAGGPPPRRAALAVRTATTRGRRAVPRTVRRPASVRPPAGVRRATAAVPAVAGLAARADPAAWTASRCSARRATRPTTRAWRT
ncbi:MAG: aryl-sulfate sulfotransferase [Planctomycetes bacterium]|nr:aryl-sulfate sulfotransferase [Planctomycetota bacterium]